MVTPGSRLPNALVNTAFPQWRLSLVVLGGAIAIAIGFGCATMPAPVPVALDPANPEAETAEISSTLTPLVVPGPEKPGDGSALPSEPTAEPAHAGHNMAEMKKSEPMEGKPSPHAGHNMAEMKKSEPMEGKPSPHAGHEVGGVLDSEQHLMGVVTRTSAGVITVLLETGSPAVVLIDTQTVFERGAAKATFKSIKNGERIVVYATPKETKWLARVVKLGSPSSEEKGSDAGTPSVSPDFPMKMPDAKNPHQAQQFTCPMHPEVRSSTQGKCPKCGMKLVPVPAK